MKAWRELEGGARTWTAVTGGPEWRTGPRGEISARRSGAELALEPSSLELASAKRVAGKLGPGLSSVIARMVGSGDVGDWYLRALLSLAVIECPRAELPCLGDCRRDGIPVPCGSEGADAPRSAGFYQITRGTAPRTGVTFGELQRDPQANHEAALTLARAEASRHGLDFPSLAVIWNAGSVRPDARNAWGVHAWSPELVSRYVRAWNAIGPVRVEGSSNAGIGGALVLGTIAALLLASCSSSASEREAARAANQTEIASRATPSSSSSAGGCPR